MNHLGPLFAQTLVQNIGGNASRSELDRLSDPLKKLVVSQASAQAWLEGALFHESFPSTQVTPEEKMMFLKKIIGYVHSVFGEFTEIGANDISWGQTPRREADKHGGQGVLAVM